MEDLDSTDRMSVINGITITNSRTVTDTRGWQFVIRGKTYYRKELEDMSQRELTELLSLFHDACLTSSMVGEHVWVETALANMLLKKRVDALERTLDIVAPTNQHNTAL